MSRRHSTILGASGWMAVSRAARPCASSPWALAASGRPQASSPARAMERRPVRGEEEGFVSALVWSIFVVLESRSEEHTSELQSQSNLVCRLLLEKKKKAAVGVQFLIVSHVTRDVR